jgi:hypothetical protein
MQGRPNLVLAVVAGLVIALAVVAGVLAVTREPPDLDPTTPDGTVQLFLVAFIEEDEEEARKYLDPSLDCDTEDFGLEGPATASLTVVSSRVDGDRAEVEMDITEPRSGPYEPWTRRESYELRRDGDLWLLVDDRTPWPLYFCN